MPSISAYAHVNVQQHYDTRPFSILGGTAQIQIMPENWQTWGPTPLQEIILDPHWSDIAVVMFG